MSKVETGSVWICNYASMWRSWRYGSAVSAHLQPLFIVSDDPTLEEVQLTNSQCNSLYNLVLDFLVRAVNAKGPFCP